MIFGTHLALVKSKRDKGGIMKALVLILTMSFSIATFAEDSYGEKSTECKYSAHNLSVNYKDFSDAPSASENESNSFSVK